jgi:hypothetical protein
MSCRTTKGGTAAHRIARAVSGLSDNTVQSLFHALKREGADLTAPTDEEVEAWRVRMRALMTEIGMSDAQIERTERDLFLSRDENPDGPTFYSWSNIEARARQEAIIRTVKGMVVDLDEPGSQSEFYELGEDGRPVKVWYASYGSNLSRDRFMTYIAGGTPEGTLDKHEGSRDHTEPEEDVPIRYSGRLHFAGNSGRWDGGVAFIDNDTSGHALGRAYLINMQQFDDVVAQENGKSVGSVTVDTTKALTEGVDQVMPVGLYGTLVHIGDYENAPVFTFTGKNSAQDNLTLSRDGKSFGGTNAPGNNYLRMIGSGLQETFGMGPQEQADYLRGALGVTNMNRDALINVVSTPPEKVKRPKPKYSTKSTYSSSSRRSGRGLGTSAWEKRDERWVPRRSDMWYGDSWDEPTDYDEPDFHWWDFDSEDEYEQALTEFTRSSTRRLECNYCFETGHNIDDCPNLGLIGPWSSRLF